MKDKESTAKIRDPERLSVCQYCPLLSYGAQRTQLLKAKDSHYDSFNVGLKLHSNFQEFPSGFHGPALDIKRLKTSSHYCYLGETHTEISSRLIRAPIPKGWGGAAERHEDSSSCPPPFTSVIVSWRSLNKLTLYVSD